MFIILSTNDSKAKMRQSKESLQYKNKEFSKFLNA